MEQFKTELDDLREDNCDLHQDIQTLNEKLMRKEVLKGDFKLLKADKKALTQRNSGLKKELAKLQKKLSHQQALEDKYEAAIEENEHLNLQNYLLQKDAEEMFARVNGKEVLVISGDKAPNTVPENEVLTRHN